MRRLDGVQMRVGPEFGNEYRQKSTPDGASPIRRNDNPTEEPTVFWWQLSS